ncbi:hypothetical protein B5F71_06855 [Bacteroides sp. An269]|nr:hypothetical protein B5F71_06855 [Bacteroides sp. An269]
MRFTGLPCSASVARQSGEGGFSVQTNRASCVFVRQKCFCPTKTSGPPGAGVFLQSRKQGKYIWVKTQGQGQAGSPKTIQRTTNTASA